MKEILDSNNDEKGAAIKLPPLLIFLILLLIGYGTHYLYPVNIGIRSELKYVGILLILSAVAFIFYISRIFASAKTNIEPWKPTTKIISTGIYAYSRNPIYVAFCLIPIGIGIVLDSFWIIISFFPSIVLVYFIAIKKEEAYLEQKFSAEYLQYKNSVRRWL